MGIRKIRACPYCGSTWLEPLILFGGPLAGVDNKNGTYRCRSCGRRAVPLEFSEEQELREHLAPSPREKRGFHHIPIMPLDTSALFSLVGFDLPIGRVAEIMDIEWERGELRRKDYRAKFLDYWRAISGQTYGASSILLMDLSGIEEGRPNFRAMQDLVRRRYDIWLELGMRSVQDLFDSFALDISWAVAGTMTCPNISLFEEIFELSDHCLPMIYIDGVVLWGRRATGPRDVSGTISLLRRIGYERIGVMDLSRLGRGEGPDERLLHLLKDLDIEIMLGGGITERYLEKVESMGFSGAFVDTFTPVISDIVREGDHELPSEFPAAEVIRRERRDVLPTD